MGIYNQHLKDIQKRDYFYYITFSLFVIYFFTGILNTTIGHLLALFVIGISVFLMIDYKNEESADFYKDLESKIEALSDDKNDTYYMYMDPDTLILFWEIKIDFYEFNPLAYNEALQAANYILMCRKAIETKFCSGPVIPDLSDNFTNKLRFYEDPNEKCDKIVSNSYATFEFAKKQYKRCINNLHSIILTLNVDPAMQFKHDQMIKRARLILKRNLDIIKNIYNKNTSLVDPQITFYDSFVPFNEHTEENGVNDNITDHLFNFF